jgi:hypothetical protein
MSMNVETIVRNGFLLVCGILVVTGSQRAAAAQLQQFGWVEWVLVSDARFRLKAKLDTGAKTSSINAANIEEFQRAGASWVRFTIRDRAGKAAILERPIRRRVRIRRAGATKVTRFVVELDMCLGRQFRKAEVSLTARKGLLYPVLLGRSFLAGVAVVNPSRTFLVKSSCQ